MFLEMFLRNCIITRAMLSEADAYYSWLFLMRVLKVNKVSIFSAMQIVSQLNLYLADMLPFMTEREASNLLPVLANSSTQFMVLENRLSYEKVKHVVT